MKHSSQPIPFLGRRREIDCLLRAIRGRRSLVIWGPPDSGKSALIAETLSKLPAALARRCVRVCAEGTLPRLLQQHVEQLLAAGDGVVQEAYRKQAATSRLAETWARKQTSVRLRNLLFEAFDRDRYWLFWDDARRLSLSHFHFLREVIRMRKTPVYLLACGPGEEHLGLTRRLFWRDAQRLELGPLSAGDARALLEAAIEREGLSALDLSEFREHVPEASRNLPGAILKMAAMAAEPQYQYGNRVKTNLVHVDYLVQLALRIQD